MTNALSSWPGSIVSESEPDRFDLGDLAAGLDLDVAVDRLDPDRRHRVSHQDVDDRGQRAEQSRCAHRARVTRPAEGVRDRDRLGTLSRWMVALKWAVSSSGRFPSVSIALVSTAMTSDGSSIGSRTISHVIRVRVGVAAGLDLDRRAAACRAWGRSGRRRWC